MLGEKSWVYRQLHAVHGVPGRWLCQKMCGNGGQNIENNSEVFMRQLLAKSCPARRRGQPDVCLRSNLVSLPAILWSCRQPTKTTSSYGPWPLTRHPHPSTRPRTSRRLATRHPLYQQRPREQQTLLSGIHPPTLRTRPLDLGRHLSQISRIFRAQTDVCHSRPP